MDPPSPIFLKDIYLGGASATPSMAQRLEHCPRTPHGLELELTPLGLGLRLRVWAKSAGSNPGLPDTDPDMSSVRGGVASTARVDGVDSFAPFMAFHRYTYTIWPKDAQSQRAPEKHHSQIRKTAPLISFSQQVPHVPTFATAALRETSHRPSAKLAGFTGRPKWQGPSHR